MPELKVVWLTEALTDLSNIAAYHMAKIGPNSARIITERIIGAIDRLAVFPEMGAVVQFVTASDAEYRHLIVGDYLCFYQIDGDKVLVYYIVHGSTDYIRHIFGPG